MTERNPPTGKQVFVEEAGAVRDIAELTGAELFDAFRELDHRDASTMRDWYFGHVSGAELVWDEDRTLVDGIDPPLPDWKGSIDHICL